MHEMVKLVLIDIFLTGVFMYNFLPDIFIFQIDMKVKRAKYVDFILNRKNYTRTRFWLLSKRVLLETKIDSKNFALIIVSAKTSLI